MSKCQVQWIDANGQPTPDQNEAVMVAHYHESKWSLPCGGVGNAHVGYKENIQGSYFICATHYAQVNDAMRYPRGGWTFEPLPAAEVKVNPI